MLLTFVFGFLVIFFYFPNTANANPDFQKLCAKATSFENIDKIVKCYMKHLPVKVIGIYDGCMKMMSNLDFIAFLKLICKDESSLRKWIKCQEGKFKKEYTPTAADEGKMAKLGPCLDTI